MAVLTSKKNKDEIIVTCNCGCEDAIKSIRKYRGIGL